MLNESTASKLRDKHLGVMPQAFKGQLTSNDMTSLSFEERLGLLVDAEWTGRKNNHLLRLIKKRRLCYSRSLCRGH